MSKEVAYAIIFGIMGTILGVIISLFPNYLQEKRAFYDKLARHWALLQYEIISIINMCDKRVNDIDGYLSVADCPLVAFTRLTTTAWDLAIAEGSFITSVEDEILKKLDAGYLGVKTFNTTLDTYSYFIASSRSLNGFGDNVKTYYGVFSENCKAISYHFKQELTDIIRFEKTYQSKVGIYNRIITTLWITGLTIFIFLIMSFVWGLMSGFFTTGK